MKKVTDLTDKEKKALYKDLVQANAKVNDQAFDAKPASSARKQYSQRILAARKAAFKKHNVIFPTSKGTQHTT